MNREHSQTQAHFSRLLLHHVHMTICRPLSQQASQ